MREYDSRPIVVIGARGQVGTALVQALGRRAVALTHQDVDVTDFASLNSQIPLGTRWVVNAAAFIDVDRCQEDPTMAFKVNAIGAWNVARAAALKGAGVAYMSSDYVFDGNHNSPYHEGNAINPINIYGTSKATGEIMTRLGNPHSLNVRTAHVFGHSSDGKRANIIERILTQARGGEVVAVCDHIISPTFTDHLAKWLIKVLDAGITGVIHLANDGSCSRDELARFVLSIAGLNQKVKSVRAAEISWHAPRPPRSVLESGRLKGLSMGRMPHWQEGVREYFKKRENH